MRHRPVLATCNRNATNEKYAACYEGGEYSPSVETRAGQRHVISFVGPATSVYAVCSLFAELMTGVTDVTMSATLAIDPAVRANSMEKS
jgi:hypothetical protein